MEKFGTTELSTKDRLRIEAGEKKLETEGMEEKRIGRSEKGKVRRSEK